MEALGESFCFHQIRFAGFAPDQLGKRRITLRTRDRLIQSGAHPKETFRRPFACEKFAIALIHVVCKEGGGVCIRSRDQNHRHVANIRCQTRRDEMLDGSERRHQHLPAHVAAFFLACELIFEVYAGRAGFEHCLG